MKNWQTSLYGQIAYMAFTGTGFLLMPQFVTGLLHLGAAEEVWIRVVGLLALLLCTYYYAAIKNESLWFAHASVWGRYGFCVALSALALMFGLPMLIAVAGLEAGLAVWTHRTINNP
jgi:hypothetical protein